MVKRIIAWGNSMDEKEIFDRVVNVLTENNLRQGQDYIIVKYKRGCFTIRICPRRYAVLDIHYIYDRIPDIKMFKIKQNENQLEVVLKVKIRGC